MRIRVRESYGDDFVEIESDDQAFVITVLAWFRKYQRRQRERALFKAEVARGIRERRRQLLVELKALQ